MNATTKAVVLTPLTPLTPLTSLTPLTPLTPKGTSPFAKLLLNKCEERPYHVGRLTAFRTIFNCFRAILRRFLLFQPSLFTLKHVFVLFIHRILHFNHNFSHFIKIIKKILAF